MVDQMQSQFEADPHGAYLDAVFARIDRIRQIDVSLLTDRYGIDPLALSPVAGKGEASWAVTRVLADADSQREELREHLDGLTQEFVAAGMAFEAAALKAQETLGDSGVLAKQISRSTAQSALAVDSRWMPWVRSILPNQWIFGIGWIAWWFSFTPSFSTPLLALPLLAVLSTTVGFLQGYALGKTVTPDVYKLISKTASDLKKLQKLPTSRHVTLPQRLHRLNLWHVNAQFQQIIRWSQPYGDGKIEVGDIAWDGALLLIFLAPHSKYMGCIVIGIIARKYGCRMAIRSRLAKSRQSS